MRSAAARPKEPGGAQTIPFLRARLSQALRVEFVVVIFIMAVMDGVSEHRVLETGCDGLRSSMLFTVRIDR